MKVLSETPDLQEAVGRHGTIKRLPALRGATKSMTIRMPIADIQAAQDLAEKRGLPYQTFVIKRSNARATRYS